MTGVQNSGITNLPRWAAGISRQRAPKELLQPTEARAPRAAFTAPALRHRS